jgi:hypothetical protein
MARNILNNQGIVPFYFDINMYMYSYMQDKDNR